MCHARIAARVPSARPVGVARLPEFEFRFQKRGVDGSAKADAYFTGNAADHMWGVVVEVDRAEKPELDRCEGLGRHYDQAVVPVEMTSGERIDAAIYIARPEAIASGLRPFSWYKRFVVHGAEHFQLPGTYRRFLNAFEAIEDPDRQRHAENTRLIVPVSQED